MSWKKLSRFRDPGVPKLDNLRRAAARGLRVPETRWAYAADVGADEQRPPAHVDFPLIVRSGSPTEDTRETSNAGQLLSLVVRAPRDFPGLLARVVDALPRDDAGRPRGAVFLQPLVAAREAGVAFFDGFYFERAQAAGSNEALTSGQARGDVVRGHLARGDAWSDFLARVYAVFGASARTDDGRDPTIDLEFARDDAGYVLLQVRPALFRLAKNPTLSLANHKEILGDPPSPWIASVLTDAGRSVLSFFSGIDPAVGAWSEAYAVSLADRVWMNFSFFFRLMDRWGLPRAFVTQGVGGQGGGPLDARPILGRFARSVPTLLRLQLASLAAVRRAPAALAALDARIDAAVDLDDVYAANVEAMALAIRTNFGINAVLSGVARAREVLGVVGEARVITQEMMEGYAALAEAQDAAGRERALDAWLAAFGHRGPLESDPARPRFSEMRAVLLDDVAATAAAAPPRVTSTRPRARGDDAFGPLFWIDRRREWFRDELMRRWARIRARALDAGRRLAAASVLDAPEDVFWLREDEVRAPSREAVAAAKARIAAAAMQRLPTTAPRDMIERALTEADAARAAHAGRRLFRGIPLAESVVEGRALKARDLAALLATGGVGGVRLDGDAILVVDALEPSWAVVFSRVKGVVAEIGGELSHASILLREARRPAIVNCDGIFGEVESGDLLRLDGRAGTVEILGR